MDVAENAHWYLLHLETEGRAPTTLKGIGAILLAVARHIDATLPMAVTGSEVARFVGTWRHAQGRPSGLTQRQRVARKAAIFQVTAWLRYLQRYRDPLPSAVPGTDVLTDLLASLRDERGFAPATIANHQRTLRPFLEWLAVQRRLLEDATLADVAAYLESRSAR